MAVKTAELAQNVQIVAEEIHCASAIFAVESILENRLKEQRLKELEGLRVSIEDAVLKKDVVKAAGLVRSSREIRDNLSKIIFKIRVMYEDLPEDSARHTVNDNYISIVLPQSHQKVIESGLTTGFDKWTDEMKLAKEILRKLTLHELGHVADMNLDENEADDFADKLLSLRKGRNCGCNGDVT
jgi:hypothetical protein